MKSRQLSNIPTHGFLSKCKNDLILPLDQSKSPKKTIKAMSWNYLCIKIYFSIINKLNNHRIMNEKENRDGPVHIILALIASLSSQYSESLYSDRVFPYILIQ